jgi:hypothetical protein
MNLPSLRMLSIEFSYIKISHWTTNETHSLYLHAVRVQLSR